MCLGIPGKIIEITEIEGRRMGRVDFGGAIKETCLDFVPEANVGDYCIIHVGFAISILDEQEAKETLDLFQQLEEAGEELELS